MPGAGPSAAGEPPAQDRARDLVKSRGLVRSGDRIDPVEGFEFVKRNQADYPVATLCRILGSPPVAITRG
jgi:hypothetical protein